MCSAEHQVAEFQGRQRQPDGFQVAHFAHQNGVRVLARSAERRAAANDSVIGPDSRWLIQAFRGLVHELDRVFDGEDVAVFGFVEVVDHARQRGDLPELVGPVTSTSPARFERQVGENLGRARLPASGSCSGIVRNTAPALRFWLNAFTRKRARPSISNEKSTSQEFFVGLALRVARRCRTPWRAPVLWSNASTLMRRTSPCTRIMGGNPAEVQVRCFVLDTEGQQLGNVHGSLTFGTLDSHYDHDCRQAPTGTALRHRLYERAGQRPGQRSVTGCIQTFGPDARAPEAARAGNTPLAKLPAGSRRKWRHCARWSTPTCK